MNLENPYFNHIDKKRTISPVRRYAGPVLQEIIEETHARLPNLTANHLSALSATTSVLGLLVAKDSPGNTGKRNAVAISLLGAGILLDGLDGTLARQIKSDNPVETDSGMGSIYDSTSDFIKDLTMNVTRIINAHKRSDGVGEAFAYAATVTNPLARFVYHNAISKGYDIPEIGRNLLDFFGTPTGKHPSFSIATIYPELKGIPIQHILDATITIGNIANIAMNMGHLPAEKTLDENTRRTGYLRSKFHIFTSAATLITAAGTYYALHRKNASDSNSLWQ